MAALAPYEVYAIRYAHNPNARRANNFIGGDPHDAPMPLDYFVWAMRQGSRTIILDTGFDEPMGKKRNRQFLRSPAVGLKAIGVEPDQVEHVILSHLHYDHCGNYDMFPRANYHVQEIEMAYCTGKCMCDRITSRTSAGSTPIAFSPTAGERRNCRARFSPIAASNPVSNTNVPDTPFIAHTK